MHERCQVIRLYARVYHFFKHHNEAKIAVASGIYYMLCQPSLISYRKVTCSMVMYDHILQHVYIHKSFM